MKALFADADKRVIASLLLSLVSLAVSFFSIGNLPFDAAWVAIILCGVPIIKGAVVGLVTEFDIKADVLVSIALVASVVIGEIFAAGEVAFIMALGAFLEERTVARARAGIERLVHLTPATARVVRGGGEEIVPAQAVRPGDVLRVLAGETIAVDGVVTRGLTTVDQSVMTGESLIREIPHLIKLARKTMNTIVVNLTASMVLNFAAIALAIAGVLNPVVGALVHNAGSVAVIINSSLLLKWREKAG